MSAKTKTAPKAAAKPVAPRLNEYEIAILGDLGYKGELPGELVETYLEYKKMKDHMQPGRLTPEGWSCVVMLYRLRAEAE